MSSLFKVLRWRFRNWTFSIPRMKNSIRSRTSGLFNLFPGTGKGNEIPNWLLKKITSRTARSTPIIICISVSSLCFVDSVSGKKVSWLKESGFSYELVRFESCVHFKNNFLFRKFFQPRQVFQIVEKQINQSRH